MKNENVNVPIEKPIIHLEKKPLLIVTITVLMTFYFDIFVGSIHGVSTPSIIADLGGMQFYAMTITTYMLGGSIGRVISGKLGDLYGRKRIYLISLAVFAFGLILTGSAHSISVLIAYKLVLGIAGGFLFATVFAVIADLYVSVTRVKILGYLSAMLGVTYITGPLLGGFIVDTIGWRWLYYFPLPFMLIVFFVVNHYMPTVKREVKVRIDYAGIFLLCTAAIPFLLAFSWGGFKFSWGSGTMIALYLISFVSIILFIQVERKAAEPILPLSLLRNRYFLIPVIGHSLGAVVVITYLTYVPLFGQAVKGMSAAVSGSLITALMTVHIISTLILSKIIRKTGKYRMVIALIFLFDAAMMYLVSGFNDNTNIVYIYTIIGLMGVNSGAINVVFVAYLQNHLPHNVVGTATGAEYFFTNLATVVSLSITGLIMNLNWQVGKYLPAELKGALSEAEIGVMSSTQALTNKTAAAEIRSGLSPELQQTFDSVIVNMKDIMVHIFHTMFLLNVVVLIIGAIFLALFMKSKKEQQAGKETQEVVTDAV
ncbi:MFS transporter [Neobacillus vireti]|uniref:MFS transporter n=1 Tax=Neobacillus vireti TaxID=220686 RepID=UPI002FFF44B5